MPENQNENENQAISSEDNVHNGTPANGGYCCAPKQSIMENTAFVSALEIIPRTIVITKQKIKLNCKYERKLQIKNMGLYDRRVDFGTDCEDTKIQISKHLRYRYIQPDETFDIQLVVEPKVKANKYKRRHVYIYLTHPNIVFEVPIIVLDTTEEWYPSIPSEIIFRPTAPNNLTCYEFTIFNPWNENIMTKLMKPNPKLKIIVNDKLTPKKNFIKVLLILCVTNLEEVTDIIKLKFGKVPIIEFSFTHTPIPIDCHLSVSNLHYEEIKFDRVAEKEFLICNDSEINVIIEIILLAVDENAKHCSVPVPAEIENEKYSSSSIEQAQRLASSFSIESSKSKKSLEIEKSKECSSSELSFRASDSKHFAVELSKNDMPPNSTQQVVVRFQPKMFSDYEMIGEPPFYLCTKLIVVSRYLDYVDYKYVILTGSIRGPEVEIEPQTIDLRKIYLGEEHCEAVTALNVDGAVTAKIVMQDYDNKENVTVTVNPSNGFDLQPCQRVTFILSIYAKIVGKFIFKVVFKVQNGGTHSVVIRGISQVLSLRTYPHMLEFGNIPIGVPQKRFLLLMNPCSVPLAAQVTPSEDGEETPLVLNIEDVNDLLPITVRDPVIQLLQAQADEKLYDIEKHKNAVFDEEGEEDEDEDQDEIYEDKFKAENENDDDDNDDDDDYDDDEVDVDVYEEKYKNEDEYDNKNERRSKAKYVEEVDEEKEEETEETENKLFINNNIGPNSSEITFNSIEEHSVYSSEFEMTIIEPISDLAKTVIAKIKQKRIIEKNEIEKRTMTEAMNTLLDTKYFRRMDLYKNYACMDWTALPSDPKELYCDNNIFYLLPNTGKKITILLIPNKSGYHSRFLSIRVCPSFKYNDCENITEGLYNQVDGDIIDSKVMLTKVSLEYYCIVPKMTWSNEVTFDDTNVFFGAPYFFNMFFQNEESVGGFVFYEVVPHCEDGTMTFSDNTWKFYVEPESTTYANCNVKFFKTGNVILHGLVRFLGNCCSSVFTISAFVYPMKLIGLPDDFIGYQRVCERKRYYLYLENGVPIINHLNMFLEKETNLQFIHPHGYQLAPNNHAMYLTISAMFRDPGRYKNTLYVHQQIYQQTAVPMTFIVEGTPIFFRPSIKNGYDLGNLFIVTECEFLENDPLHIFELVLKNCGNRSYQINITKTKSNTGALCALGSNSARIDIQPKSFVILPKSEFSLTISAIAYEEQFVQNEFRIQIVDRSKPKRFENIRLLVKARFIIPKIYWRPRELTLEYERTHIFKEQPVLEIVEIINSGKVEIEDLYLKTIGPFKIKEFFEDAFEKEISFKLGPSERKELTLTVHKEAVKNVNCKQFDGRVACLANNIIQIEIQPKELVLFVNRYESETVIELTNVGCTKAEYKWKKLIETVTYVDEEDDEREFIRDILSDILHMIDISESIPDEIENENLSERYRRYRCKLERLEDEIGIGMIIDEIINNLDLEHKRYIIDWDDDKINEIIDDMVDEAVYDIVKSTVKEYNCESCPESISSTSLSQKIAKETLYEILRKLKIEDSYNVSDPSSSYCSAERFAYFYEKSGIINVKEKHVCVIHLPGVRSGNELRVSFLLEVTGGESQYFTLILVNLKKTIQLSRHHVYLGIKPWYELFKANVRATNLTPYVVNVLINQMEAKVNPKQRIVEGYLHLKSEKLFEINEHGQKLIKTDGVFGLRYELNKELELIVNGGEKMYIKFRGQGVMPIFSMVSKLLHIEQDESEIYEEYMLLKRMFYFDIFEPYTEFEEEEPKLGEEEVETEPKCILNDNISTLSEYSITDISESNIEFETEGYDMGFSKFIRHEKKWKNLLDTYIVVNHQDVPNVLVLQQVLETEKFVRRLRENSDTIDILNMVYQEYIQVESVRDDMMPLNVKHFTIQPLPFEMHGFILNMEKLKMGEFAKFEFTLQFFGPGKLIAQVRTPVQIPGLFVSLHTEKVPDKVIFLQYKAAVSEINVKPYRNMWERIMDAENDPKLKHAHSFDIDRRSKHLREIPPDDRKNILNYYNSLNKSVYMEHKHHYVLSKIYGQAKRNFSGTLLHVVILIKPEAKYFKDEQFIEDIMYIDLHMGPMLPITLYGQVKA